MAKSTQKIIMTAFLELLKSKTFDKITVKDIIQRAEINRNTFYYYYSDIYDLFEAVIATEVEKFLAESPVDSTFYSEYIRAASFYLDNRDALIHVYDSKSKDYLRACMEKVTKEFVEKFVRKAATQIAVDEQGIEYVTGFYTYAIVGNTLHWFEKGLPDYRENLIREVSDSFEATVQVMLEVYQKSRQK